MSFDKRAFIEDLKSHIINYYIIEGYYGSLGDFIWEQIERECIYTRKNFEIVSALEFSNWSHVGFAIKSIDQLAFAALHEWVTEEINDTYYEELRVQYEEWKDELERMEDELNNTENEEEKEELLIAMEEAKRNLTAIQRIHNEES